MKVLVTGGAGFVGSHVCDRLLERGDEVVCVDALSYFDLDSEYTVNLKIRNVLHNFSNKNFTFLVKNAKDRSKMDGIFARYKFDAVIHLAARAGVRDSIKDPVSYAQNNIDGTLSLLECCKKYGVKRFVFISSSSVYGEAKPPFLEDKGVESPISPYAVTKLAGENHCRMYSALDGINITCLRLFNVYGPRQRPDQAPYIFTKKLLNGNEIELFGVGTKRDYTYIDDIVRGIVLALDNPFRFEIINLGNSEPVELREFLSFFERFTGKTAQIVEKPQNAGEVKITYADISKAKRLLGWEPITKVGDGVEKYVEWHRENFK